jgi:hypothetical protein
MYVMSMGYHIPERFARPVMITGGKCKLRRKQYVKLSNCFKNYSGAGLPRYVHLIVPTQSKILKNPACSNADRVSNVNVYTTSMHIPAV